METGPRSHLRAFEVIALAKATAKATLHERNPRLTHLEQAFREVLLNQRPRQLPRQISQNELDNNSAGRIHP